MVKISLRKRISRNLLLAFAIPFAGMLMVMLISQYCPFGNYSMLYSDMYHQYYPFFVEFRRAIRSGDGLVYNWAVGMGMDYLGLIAYYLASPLNLVSVILPERWLLGYFSLLVPIKLGFAGFCFAYFLKNIFDRDDPSIAVFAGFYGTCAWALGFQWNVMWLDTFAVLPLVALGTVRLLRDRKYLLYTLSLCYSVAANYYIGFFTCIFVFLLFWIYELCRWKSFWRFFEDLCRIALFSVLALSMTAVLELPALEALQTTQSSVNQFPVGFKLNIAKSNDLKGLLDAMRQVAGNMGGALEPNFKEGLPNIYCGIVSIPLMFLYLCAKEVRLRDKLCAVGLLLFFNASFIIRQLDYIWHGFHFTNMIPYRFSFLYSFVVLYMAYRAWTLRESFSIWKILLSCVLAAGILACSDQLTVGLPMDIGPIKLQFPLYAVYNLVFLVMYLCCMLSGLDHPLSALPKPLPYPEDEEEALSLQEEETEEGPEQTEPLSLRSPESLTHPASPTEDPEKRRLRLRRSATIMMACMALELAANLICFGLYFTGTQISNYPKGTDKTASVIRYMKEREQKRNNLFYRADTTHSQTLNDGALNSYRGVSAFTSSANVRVTLFMQALGYGAKNTYNRYLFEESSPVSNLFLGLRYMIERDGRDRSGSLFKEANRFGNTILLENQAWLPLGFLTEPGLADLTFDADSGVFPFQNKLFSTATGLYTDVWHEITGDNLNILGEGVTIADRNDSGYCSYKSTQARSNLIYSYTVDSDGFACIHLNLPKRNTYYISLNGQELFSESISLPQMMAAAEVKTGDLLEVRIVCEKDESSNMTVKAAILDLELFRQGYELLNASTLTLTDFSSTLVEGTIDCDRDGLLYTSIPQNGNWIVYLDGKKTDSTLVGNCMLAVSLSAGSHSLRLVYRNLSLLIGALISFLATAILVLLHWYDNRRRPRGRFEK